MNTGRRTRLLIGVGMGLALLAVGCRRDAPPTQPPSPEDSAAASPTPPAPLPTPTLDVDAAADTVASSDAALGAVTTARSKPTHRRAAPGPAPAGGGAITGLKVTGSIPRSVAEATVRGTTTALRACVDKEAEQHPGLHGDVQFKLTTNDRGVVELAEVLRSTLGGNEAELCMVQSARRMKFPPPPGGGASAVTFQMKF